MCYAGWFPCRSSGILVHCRQNVQKDRDPDLGDHLDYWLNVSILNCLGSSNQILIDLSLQTASNGIALLVVGRIVAGLCVGIASAMVPVYQAEIAPKEIRGRVVSLQQWAITW
jgi:MFS family permease